MGLSWISNQAGKGLRMKYLLMSAAIAALTSLGACAPNGSETEPVMAPDTAAEISFEAAANQILAKAYPADGPGVTAIVTKDNETVFLGARGLANLETEQPLATDSVFRLASITKQFAAATLMLLVEDGTVDLDAPIKTYLPDYPEPGASIEVRRLLNHTSGIPSYTSIPGWMIPANTGRERSTREMIEVFSDLPADFEPGEEWRYNNSGYLLVGAIIESVTGEPWADVVKARIAEPLGLTSLDSGLAESEIDAFVVGYTDTDSPQLAQKLHQSVPHAAGALISDVEDLAIWGNALHDLEVVSPASYQEMIAPTPLNSGDSFEYGYGLGLGTLLDQDVIGHSGGIFGFSTNSVYVPSEDLFVAVLANSDSPTVDPGTTMNRLVALALATPFPEFSAQDIDLSTLESAFGIYRSDSVTRSFFARDGELFTYRENGVESRAYSAGNNQFFYDPNGLEWFELDLEATPATMAFYSSDSREPDVLEWSEPIPEEISVAPEILDTYLGVYVLEIPPMAVVAAQNGDLENGITLQLTGQPAFPLDVISETEFAVRSVGAIIRFAPTEAGAMGLQIEQGGATYAGTKAED